MVQGKAANCKLTIKCNLNTCTQDVSYVEETCFYVVFSGIHDPDMEGQDSHADHAGKRDLLNNAGHVLHIRREWKGPPAHSGGSQEHL